MDTVRKTSKVTGTLIVVVVAAILTHHWYLVSDNDYFDIIKAFMMTRASIGGAHIFFINLAFWFIVITSVLSAALGHKYAFDILSVSWVPMLIMCALAILFIPPLGFRNAHLFWLICYILMVIGLWMSVRQLMRLWVSNTNMAKLLKKTKGAEGSEESDAAEQLEINGDRVDFFAALGMTLLSMLLLAALVIGALIFGIGNRELIAGDDDVTPVVLSIQYDAAVDLMDNGEYEKAMYELRNLGNYNDSRTLATKCEDLLYGPTYREAVLLMGREKYDDARSKFWSIYDYKDSAKKVELCNDLQYGPQYDEAIACMEEERYEDAIVILQELSDVGYKDSYKKIEECEKSMITSLAGTWNGDAGSQFTLKEDMTCSYVDGGGPKGDGTWSVVDGRLFISTSAFSYELYGDLNTGYLTTSVLVKADSSSWRDETFSKE